MARVKPKRHGVVTDMTAMCDVTFLLLTFFIMTTSKIDGLTYKIDEIGMSIQQSFAEFN